MGKVLNYAAIYGTTGFSIARRLACTEREAKEQLQQFWETYPNLYKGQEDRKQWAKKHGRTYTIIGRIRKLPALFTRDRGALNGALRQVINTACQGSCGDCVKLAMVALEQQRKQPESLVHRYDVRTLVPVFDDLLIRGLVPAESEKEATEREIRNAIEVTVTFEGRSTKMRCDLGWSTVSWLHAMGKAPQGGGPKPSKVEAPPAVTTQS